MNLKAESVETVEDSLRIGKDLLNEVAMELRKEKWFANQGWTVSVHYYPPEPEDPEWFSMHVSKKHWFNEDRQGIHFETHLGPKQLAEQECPVMLHLFHSKTIPGKTIKRDRVARPFVDATYGRISGWDGYVFRAGKYGTQPFTYRLAFTEETFVILLKQQLDRLCSQLGPEIDSALESALSE